jgi:hypothetical protein
MNYQNQINNDRETPLDLDAIQIKPESLAQGYAKAGHIFDGTSFVSFKIRVERILGAHGYKNFIKFRNYGKPEKPKVIPHQIITTTTEDGTSSGDGTSDEPPSSNTIETDTSGTHQGQQQSRVTLDDYSQRNQKYFEKQKKWEMLRSYIVGTILLLCDEEHQQMVDGIEDPFEVMDKFRTSYMSKVMANRVRLQNELAEFKINHNEKLIKSFNRLDQIARQLNNCGEPVSDSQKMTCLLRAFPREWQNYRAIYENENTLSYMGLCEKLQTAEISKTLPEVNSNNVPETLMVKPGKRKGNGSYPARKRTKTDIKQCEHCKKKGHTKSDCWYKSTSYCTKCNKPGHSSDRCTKNVHKELAGLALMVKTSDQSESWVLDVPDT